MEKSLEKKVEDIARLLREIQEEQRKGIAEIKGMVDGMKILLTHKN